MQNAYLAVFPFKSLSFREILVKIGKRLRVELSDTSENLEL